VIVLGLELDIDKCVHSGSLSDIYRLPFWDNWSSMSENTLHTVIRIHFTIQYVSVYDL